MNRKKNGNLLAFDIVVRKEIGERAWKKLGDDEKQVVRELSQVDGMGGAVGTMVVEEHKRPSE